MSARSIIDFLGKYKAAPGTNPLIRKKDWRFFYFSLKETGALAKRLAGIEG